MKSIHVSDEVHARIKARAAIARQTMDLYVESLLERDMQKLE